MKWCSVRWRRSGFLSKRRRKKRGEDGMRYFSRVYFANTIMMLHRLSAHNFVFRILKCCCFSIHASQWFWKTKRIKERKKTWIFLSKAFIFASCCLHLFRCFACVHRWRGRNSYANIGEDFLFLVKTIEEKAEKLERILKNNTLANTLTGSPRERAR